MVLTSEAVTGQTLVPFTMASRDYAPSLSQLRLPLVVQNLLVSLLPKLPIHESLSQQPSSKCFGV